MFTLNCKGKLLCIKRPLIMGILNLNEDSFYEGSRISTMDALLSKARQMLHEGADILDIGGQSTRPGSIRISAGEELSRILPAIELLAKEFDNAVLSVDTYYAEVAKQAVAAGAAIVNDISAGELDSSMIEMVAGLAVPYICMHMKGTPETMQQQAVYEDVVKEVLDFFIKKVAKCRLAGIHDIIIDPGFGFAKTIDQNFNLLKSLGLLKMLEVPVMAGISRKSTVYKTLDIPVEDSLNGTTVLHTIALQNGADILRVHDVKEAREAMRLFAAYSEA